MSDERALRASLERLQGEVKRLEAWTPEPVNVELKNAAALRLTEVQAELERAHEQLAEAEARLPDVEAELAETKAATRAAASHVFGKQQSSLSPDHQSAVNFGGALGVLGAVLAALLGSFTAGFVGPQPVGAVLVAVGAGLAARLGWKRL